MYNEIHDEYLHEGYGTDYDGPLYYDDKILQEGDVQCIGKYVCYWNGKNWERIEMPDGSYLTEKSTIESNVLDFPILEYLSVGDVFNMLIQAENKIERLEQELKHYTDTFESNVAIWGKTHGWSVILLDPRAEPILMEVPEIEFHKDENKQFIFYKG